MDINNIFTSEKELKWVNKQRTLIVSTKNITERANQLMLDFHNFLPHSKKESKLERGNYDEQIKELCLLHSCRSFLFFECRKKNLYIWIGRFPNGPSIKYYVENLHNSKDYKLKGNCMKASRPILSFDCSFATDPVMQLQRELFIHTFNVPNHHPKSTPCTDRVFSWMKDEASMKIWLRQYEVKYEKVGKEVLRNELMEVGPRMILDPICILEGCLSGKQLYKNTQHVGPKQTRLNKIKAIRENQDQRKKKESKKEKLMAKQLVPENEIDNIFDGEFQERKEIDDELPDFTHFKKAKKILI